MNMFRSGIALVSLCLTACAVGPNYSRPEVALPQSYRHVPVASSGQESRIDEWWLGFNDPTLVNIVERVLAQNLDLAASMARIEQARAVARGAVAAELPAANVDAQAVRQRQSLQSALGELASSKPGYQRDVALYSAGVGASWELDLAGGLRRGAEADMAMAQAAEADHAGVRVSVAAEAADAYLRIRSAQARIELAMARISADDQLLGLVRSRLREGVSTVREQAQAEARLAQVRAILPLLQEEKEVQLDRLDVLMAAAPGTCAAELVRPVSQVDIPSMTIALAPRDLLYRRPDVAAAERRLAASTARIGEATAEYYPRVSLSALLGFESLRTATPSAANLQPLAAVGLHWRLFDFGRVDAEIARAKGAAAESLALYRKALLRATEDVETALMRQWRLDAERRELLQEIDANMRSWSAAQQAYKGGALSMVEFLEQDRQLLAARDQLLRVQFDTGRAAVATFRAVGGGW